MQYYKEGCKAMKDGIPVDLCPYNKSTYAGKNWLAGWYAAYREG